MSIQDPRWDDSYKYLWFNDNGPWSIRFTSWYTAGLLHRNQGNDVARAKMALQKMSVGCFSKLKLSLTIDK